MSYCAYFLFVLGAMASISVAVKEQLLLETIASIDKGSTDTAEEKGQNETRLEEYFTSAEKDKLVLTINDLRRTVGAADMTYLDWSTEMENHAATFTTKCNYDSWTVTTGWGMKQWGNTPMDPVATLKQIFADSRFYYGVRSVFLLGIGVNISFCNSAIVHGVTHYNVYIGCYLFSHSMYFQEKEQQYSIGTACTKCRSYVFWCDGGLCRDDCTSQMSTCSCFAECHSCGDWNNKTCKCPSKPYTDAGTLGCNKGETPYKTRDLWATIVLSALALFYLL